LWIGFSSVDSQTLSDHFIKFTYSSGGFRARWYFLQLIWLLCVCCMKWKKSAAVQKLRMYSSSTSEQCQIRLLSLVEDYEHISSFELSYLVIELTYLFEHHIIFVIFHYIDV
jgi:hypothetical protein